MSEVIFLYTTAGVLLLFSVLLVGFLLGSNWQLHRMKQGFENWYEIDMARTLYGEEDWARHLFDCKESHLPGTCPLCGGE